MAYYDVFNGDADGLCALQQLRLAEPRDATLVTGVKRDISLLGRVTAGAGDEVTVLDVSLDKNRDALLSLLAAGARVRYFDHHFAGDIPDHPGLTAHIDTSPETCTSLLVNEALQGAHRAWAVVGAFGDNFAPQARALAAAMGLDDAAVSQLEELGICLNYNGYGATPDDLHFRPDALFRELSTHPDPLQFAKSETFATLKTGYDGDLARARGVEPELQAPGHALLILPAERWARRVSGVYANMLATDHPGRAHALLTRLPGGGFLVSVRAPLSDRDRADSLCREFPTGGGRKAAAGINELPETLLAQFSERFRSYYP